jgi:membrane-associated PAP2 superfamily phosphatase
VNQISASRPISFGWLAGLPALLMLFLLVVDLREIDFALARPFYESGEGFIWRYSYFFEQIMHTRARQVVIFGALIILLAWVASSRDWALSGWRRELTYSVLAIVLSAAVVPLLKALTDVHCPWSLSEFGGIETYTPFLSLRAETMQPGRCWPGGHAATGFSLLALFFALRDRRPEWAKRALIGALVLGWVLSLGRMVQGAHFISHNLWTLLIDWQICLVLYRLMLYRRPELASPVRSSRAVSSGQSGPADSNAKPA